VGIKELKMWKVLTFLITATCVSSSHYTPPSWFENCEAILKGKLQTLKKLESDNKITFWPSAATESILHDLQEEHGLDGCSKDLMGALLTVVQSTIVQNLLFNECQRQYPRDVFLKKAHSLIGENARFESRKEWADNLVAVAAINRFARSRVELPIPRGLLTFLFTEGLELIGQAISRPNSFPPTKNCTYPARFIAAVYYMNALSCKTYEERVQLDETFCAGIIDHQPFASYVVNLKDECSSKAIAMINDCEKMGLIYQCPASKCWRTSQPLFAFAGPDPEILGYEPSPYTFTGPGPEIVGYDPLEKFACSIISLWNILSKGTPLRHCINAGVIQQNILCVPDYVSRAKLPEKNDLIISMQQNTMPACIGIVWKYDRAKKQLFAITSTATIKSPCQCDAYGPTVCSYPLSFVSDGKRYILARSAITAVGWVLTPSTQM